LFAGSDVVAVTKSSVTRADHPPARVGNYRLLSKTSSRLGVPSLLLFLLLGMLAGSEGLLGIEFEDFALAQRYGIIALAFILFSGGAGTAWRDIRRCSAPGVALATVGVLLSAVVLGAIAAAILGLDAAPGHAARRDHRVDRRRGRLLDPALPGRGHHRGLKHLLELESGSNDPAAVFLTVGIIGLIEGRPRSGVTDLAGLFVLQMGVGTRWPAGCWRAGGGADQPPCASSTTASTRC
jgi:potassium/hydrogen antiporter